jgi:hypothetical protein
MKKIIALTSLFLFASAPAFAAGSATGAATTATAGYILQSTAPATTNIVKTSKGVMIGWNTAATGYSIDTYHTNGTKQYGTAYDSTAVWFKDVGTNATFTNPSSSVTSEAFSGWTAM